MGMTVSVKFQQAENDTPGFNISENCLECDGLAEDPIHVELTGVPFTVDSTKYGTTHLSFVVPRHIAEKMGLVDPAKPLQPK